MGECRVMAEWIKGRVIATRAGVSLALLALVAGVTGRARSGPDVRVDQAAQSSVPANSVGTEQVRDGSLLFRDMRRGQVVSTVKFRKFLALDHKDLNALALKIRSLDDKWSKAFTSDGTARNAAK